jgi:hypothetical protein
VALAHISHIMSVDPKAACFYLRCAPLMSAMTNPNRRLCTPLQHGLNVVLPLVEQIDIFERFDPGEDRMADELLIWRK